MLSNFCQAFKRVFFAETSEKNDQETTPLLHEDKLKPSKSVKPSQRTHHEVLAALRLQNYETMLPIPRLRLSHRYACERQREYSVRRDPESQETYLKATREVEGIDDRINELFRESDRLVEEMDKIKSENK